MSLSASCRAKAPTRRRIIREICGSLRLLLWLVLLLQPRFPFAPPAPLRYAGAAAELTLSEISPRTLLLELSPLDDQAPPAAPSTILVPLRSHERLRARELPREKKLRTGHLRVTIKPEPLTLSVRRADGTLVQELVFDDTPNA